MTPQMMLIMTHFNLLTTPTNCSKISTPAVLKHTEFHRCISTTRKCDIKMATTVNFDLALLCQPEMPLNNGFLLGITELHQLYGLGFCVRNHILACCAGKTLFVSQQAQSRQCRGACGHAQTAAAPSFVMQGAESCCMPGFQPKHDLTYTCQTAQLNMKRTVHSITCRVVARWAHWQCHQAVMMVRNVKRHQYSRRHKCPAWQNSAAAS